MVGGELVSTSESTNMSDLSVVSPSKAEPGSSSFLEYPGGPGVLDQIVAAIRCRLDRMGGLSKTAGLVIQCFGHGHKAALLEAWQPFVIGFPRFVTKESLRLCSPGLFPLSPTEIMPRGGHLWQGTLRQLALTQL